MDSLPDEVLLHILGFLDDGLDLLDVVPLVCKRWYGLSKDRRAWASVVVNVPCSDHWLEPHHSNCDPCKEARVLLHAPFVGEFCLYTEELPCLFVFSALGRSEAPAKVIRFPKPNQQRWDPFEHMDPNKLSVLLDFLKRSAGHLRVLELGGMLRTREAETTLSRLGRLESLTLFLHNDFVPTGALRGALPRLVRLEVMGFGYTFPLEDGAVRTLTYLVRGAAGTLRQLLLDHVLLPPAVVAAVQECRELRELSCDVLHVSMATSLPKLRRLQLDRFLCCLSPEEDDINYAEVLSSATASLMQCGTLPSLRHLSVDCADHVDRFEGCGFFQIEFVLLLETLCRAASSVTTVHFRVGYSLPPKIVNMLEPMRALRHVYLDPCPPEAFSVLAGLPHLDSLSGWVWFEESEGEGPSQAKIAEFKRKRPEVKTELSLFEY